MMFMVPKSFFIIHVSKVSPAHQADMAWAVLCEKEQGQISQSNKYSLFMFIEMVADMSALKIVGTCHVSTNKMGGSLSHTSTANIFFICLKKNYLFFN